MTVFLKVMLGDMSEKGEKWMIFLRKEHVVSVDDVEYWCLSYFKGK